MGITAGIQLVTWTYDPLLARNAWLNVGKLGVICGRYHTHFYGQDEDRFHVEWWLESERVGERLAGMRPRTRTDYPATAITIPIPHDYLALERSDPRPRANGRTQPATNSPPSLPRFTSGSRFLA